ncbi:B12-binding domain-containing radical SAM protein [Marichromatium purpuratum]|uniref:B12-binding domain-containing radical SAM protein n=1 Tax=Marichromatium purpuratum TaxID=37487 RepID=UPI00021E6750|nr:B12-binding domain-containing radical SAM protein [Marichromatium purpuratum]
MRQTAPVLKIAFVNPPYLARFSRTQRSPAVTKSGTLYFPMWLAAAAALCAESGHEIDLIDAPASGADIEAVLARLAHFAPRLLVVETSTPSIASDLAFCARARERLPGTCVALVGTHASARAQACLRDEPAVDLVVLGEYDLGVRDLAAALARDEPVSTVAGLCYRDGDRPRLGAARAVLDDLDRLPPISPIYRRFLDIRDYFNPNAIHPMVTISTSRGCPNHCTFCVYPQTITGHRLRRRSAGHVVDELEYIRRAFPEARSVFFEDDTFPADRARCAEICEEMIRRGFDLPWSANVRVDVEPETLRLMRRAGCRNLCVGFESGDQALLDRVRKRITLAQSRAFMREARALGLIVHGCFMVGLPGETPETMRRTLELAIELAPDTAQFYPIMVYPGTAAYDWYAREGMLVTEDFSRWLTPAGLHNTVVRSAVLDAEALVAFCDQARRRFYLRPRYLWRRLGLVARDREEFRRTWRAGRTFLRHLLRGSDIEAGHG